jgi:hypothetical protein
MKARRTTTVDYRADDAFCTRQLLMHPGQQEEFSDSRQQMPSGTRRTLLLLPLIYISVSLFMATRATN